MLWSSWFGQTDVFPYAYLLLVARAREDTEKIDRDVKQKAEHLHHIATVCVSTYLILILFGDINVHLCPPFDNELIFSCRSWKIKRSLDWSMLLISTGVMEPWRYLHLFHFNFLSSTGSLNACGTLKKKKKGESKKTGKYVISGSVEQQKDCLSFMFVL